MVDNGCEWISLKLLRLIKAYYASIKVKIRASASDLMPFAPTFDKDVLL